MLAMAIENWLKLLEDLIYSIRQGIHCNASESRGRWGHGDLVRLIVVVTLMFLQVSLLSTLLASCSAFAFQAINWSFAIPARRTRRAEADNQETKHFQQQMHVSHTGWTSKGASVTFKIPKGNSIFEKTLENPFFPHGFSYKVNLWKKKYGKFVKGTAFDFRKPLGRKYSNVDGF